jgi:hypothetical protein
MSGSSGEEEENYWPGYVDALTTMVMVLVFVMMLLAVVVFSLSQNVSKVLIEQIVKVVDPNAKFDPNATAEQMTAQLIEKIKLGGPPPPNTNRPTDAPPGPPINATAVPETKISANEVEDAPETKEIKAMSAPAMLTLIFPKRTTKLDEKTAAEVDSFAKGSENVASAGSIDIHSVASPTSGSVSEARRLAYYRGMLVRAQLAKSGVPQEKIHLKIEIGTDEKAEDTVKVYAKP